MISDSDRDYRMSLYNNTAWDIVKSNQSRIKEALGTLIECTICDTKDEDEYYLVLDTEEYFCEDCIHNTKWEI